MTLALHLSLVVGIVIGVRWSKRASLAWYYLRRAVDAGLVSLDTMTQLWVSRRCGCSYLIIATTGLHMPCRVAHIIESWRHHILTVFKCLL